MIDLFRPAAPYVDAAAGATRTFQLSISQSEAAAALPQLRDYFRLVARASPLQVDIEAAARAELDWWQARRKVVRPEEYGLLIAHVSTLLYGINGEEVRRSGVLRAQAMQYRDDHGTTMRLADWAVIEEKLGIAYSLLKQAISTKPRSRLPKRWLTCGGYDRRPLSSMGSWGSHTPTPDVVPMVLLASASMNSHRRQHNRDNHNRGNQTRRYGNHRSVHGRSSHRAHRDGLTRRSVLP